jgi:hypothetical protein
MKQLSCEHVKRIDMVDYLSSLNHHPQKVRNQNYWYLSPLRQEKTANSSFPQFYIKQTQHFSCRPQFPFVIEILRRDRLI